MKSREDECTDAEKEIGENKLDELLDISRLCIIRRTQALLIKYLPVKYEHIICCSFTEQQQKTYEETFNTFCKSKNNLNNLKQAQSLTAITLLKKICNHPCLADDNKSNIDFHIGIIKLREIFH